MQIISYDKTVRSDTVQDSKEFNSQSLPTKGKKGEQFVSMITAIEKSFDIMGDDIGEFSKENESLKNKIGYYDEKWLEDFKAKLLKQVDDEKGAKLFLSRMQEQMEKH